MKKLLGAVFAVGAVMATSFFARSGSQFNGDRPIERDFCVQDCIPNLCGPANIYDLYCERHCLVAGCTSGWQCVPSC